MVRDEFKKVAVVSRVWIGRPPSGIAFVQFKEDADVQKAIRVMDGEERWGFKLKVKLANSKPVI